MKKKNSNIKKTYNWIKDNPILFMWAILSCSALFNLGYFAKLNIKYIAFLHISDYYAATIISMCLMLCLTCGVWLFFFDKDENLISRMCKIYRSFMPVLVNSIKFKCKIKQINKKMKHIRQSNCFKKQKKLYNLIQKETLRIVSEIETTNKKIKHLLKEILVISFQMLLICGIYFFFAYRFFGIAGCILLFSVFVATIYVDATLKYEQLRTIVRSLIFVITIPIFGYLNLIYDMKNNKIKLCIEDRCVSMLRKVESGYFAIDKCDLLFLDNTFNVKIKQPITSTQLNIVCKYHI